MRHIHTVTVTPTVTLKTDTGSLNLKLSPSALQNLKHGEQVTLEIGVRQSSPAASPMMDDAGQRRPASSWDNADDLWTWRQGVVVTTS